MSPDWIKLEKLANPKYRLNKAQSNKSKLLPSKRVALFKEFENHIPQPSTKRSL
jgi:hypothetical protein